MNRKYYAFSYTDGRNTTTGGDYGVKLHIAGSLYSFNSKQARDEFVAEINGYDARTGRINKVDAVTTRSLPMGWSTSDAQEYDEDEN